MVLVPVVKRYQAKVECNSAPSIVRLLPPSDNPLRKPGEWRSWREIVTEPGVGYVLKTPA